MHSGIGYTVLVLEYSTVQHIGCIVCICCVGCIGFISYRCLPGTGIYFEWAVLVVMLKMFRVI